MSIRNRSYQEEVSSRVERLRRSSGVDVIGEVGFGSLTYPLYRVVLDKQTLNPRMDILISGGVHGDEPAGVYAVLNFLENHAHDYLDRFRFFAYPCINPSGFERNTLENLDGVNLNRGFKQSPEAQEVFSVQRSLQQGPKRYLFTVDMHEVDPNYEGEGFTKKDNPRDFYLYEFCPERKLRVGDRVITALEGDTPICKWEHIYGDKNSNGVVWYPEGNENPIYAELTTFEGFLVKNYTGQAFTTETPTSWNLERRIQLHIRALSIALQKCGNRRK